MNDGAGALVLASDEWAKANDRKALATIVAQAAVADDFPYLARTPANATKPRWRRPACRSTTSTCSRSTRPSPPWRSTRCGCWAWTRTRSTSTAARSRSAIPIGASGARILMTLVNELRRRGGGLGVAAICSGGGQGDAMIIEVNGA